MARPWPASRVPGALSRRRLDLLRLRPGLAGAPWGGAVPGASPLAEGARDEHASRSPARTGWSATTSRRPARGPPLSTSPTPCSTTGPATPACAWSKPTRSTCPSHAQFDLVCSFNAFEHVADPEAVLREAVRVTKPGGAVYLLFGPLYWSSYGLHASLSITVPFCHVLFERSVLESYVAERELHADPVRDPQRLARWAVPRPLAPSRGRPAARALPGDPEPPRHRPRRRASVVLSQQDRRLRRPPRNQHRSLFPTAPVSPAALRAGLRRDVPARGDVDELLVPELEHQQRPDPLRVVLHSRSVAVEQLADVGLPKQPRSTARRSSSTSRA